MNILQRILKIGQAEAHATVNGLEDPIKMTEQGIRDMRDDLDKSILAMGEVKAMAIRARNQADACRAKAQSFEQKAVEVLQAAQKGDVDSAQADRLAGEALRKKEENLAQSTTAQAEQLRFEKAVGEMEQNIKALRGTIGKWENELQVLKSRVTVSHATKTINKQMAQIDSSGTVALLERMKQKVLVEESLAEAYGEIAQDTRALDEEIDQTLQKNPAQTSAQEVAALKAKLGFTPTGETAEAANGQG